MAQREYVIYLTNPDEIVAVDQTYCPPPELPVQLAIASVSGSNRGERVVALLRASFRLGSFEIQAAPPREYRLEWNTIIEDFAGAENDWYGHRIRLIANFAQVSARQIANEPADLPPLSGDDVQTQARTTVVAPQGASSRGGRRVSRAELAARAETYVKRNGYPGLNSLARSLCSSPSSLTIAISSSAYLKARKAEFKKQRSAKPRETPLTDLYLDNIAQDTEPDPEERLSQLIAEQSAEMGEEERRTRPTRPTSHS